MKEKKLKELLAGSPHEIVAGNPEITVEALAYDSRECSQGTLFFCIPGFNVDGNDFIPEALARGASALVTERAGIEVPAGITLVRVPDSRKAMGMISAAFFDNPASKLHLVGVTGTNGKTSIAFLADALHRELGFLTGLLGTVENRIGDEIASVKRTTPEALDLQAFLYMMTQKKCTHAIMEVSSHAVALKRIDGCVFKAAIFTNLTQDHLDFHKSLDDYFDAKKRLFTDYLSSGGAAILNADDPSAASISKELSSGVVTYGASDAADVRAVGVECRNDGISYTVKSPFAPDFGVKSPLMGMFNVSNTLATVAYGLSQKFPVEAICGMLKKMKGVPGRFERIDEGQRFKLFVDYAHTPDGLLNILRSAREICAGRLIVVFGAGGDRDKSKRPLMGAAAAQNADFVIVTSDNPRTEDPDQIIDQIVQGIEQALL
ncbi:MAG TPA: UDP-N-acetylmuramoyl-L-alanyl-D-glutamate--2,6-diaminopimelate ligase, partial [bacterium]|nr:UDP-N-acetylmuramoyl-L-alanyl-D-glutamate--2,6-diaminopimelate ligase [bacterium]